MDLVKLSSLNIPEDQFINEIPFEYGSGRFIVPGGVDENKTIVIHYHKPQNFTEDSKVVIVLPGAGRNGDDYRDAWIEASEQFGVLVLALSYSESNYPGMWSYNLSGMVSDVNISDQTFNINHQSDEWLFKDFDRIFKSVKSKLNLSTDKYDMFGHSAGGQVLHRLALFHSAHQADRILAANSGWYTLPDEEEDFPYGLGKMKRLVEDVDFSAKLVIFLGEKDNADETRGHLRHTPEADRQGLHRLARGQNFYTKSKAIAAKLNKDYNWSLEIIPDVGHDYRAMSEHAAVYLYGH